MSISFAAALAGTVLAAVGTGLAIRLCLRKPRADMVAWVIALAGQTVGLAAQAAGYRRGFVPTTFRATQLGTALVAPVALAWGMVELAAKSLVARFAVTDVEQRPVAPDRREHGECGLHVHPYVAGVHRNRERLGWRQPRAELAVDK